MWYQAVGAKLLVEEKTCIWFLSKKAELSCHNQKNRTWSTLMKSIAYRISAVVDITRVRDLYSQHQIFIFPHEIAMYIFHVVAALFEGFCTYNIIVKVKKTKSKSIWKADYINRREKCSRRSAQMRRHASERVQEETVYMSFSTATVCRSWSGYNRNLREINKKRSHQEKHYYIRHS